MTILTFTVTGLPAPQGSKRGFYNEKIGRVQMVESSKKVKPWRQDVKAEALNTIAALPYAWETPVGALHVTVRFRLPRPKGHYRTGRNAALLRDAAPSRPTTKPDLDKLVRSTLDALKEAGVYRDDSQVVDLTVGKFYAVDGQTRPGALIEVEPAVNHAFFGLTPQTAVPAASLTPQAAAGTAQEAMF